MFATLYSHPQQILIAPPDTCGGIAPPDTCGGVARAKDEGNKRFGKIQDGLESSISVEGRARITRILGEVHSLTDVEKLLLYLKLPTGLVQDDQNRLSPPSCLPTSNRKEQGEAFTWIKSHLEEHGDVCMPKAEVYDEYRQYCDLHDLRPLCNADFGKMMKQVFPEINTRRLGQRGQSKYFYGGLRKKTDHAPPTLPELEIITKCIEIDTTAMDCELFKSSCQLVCEWADKVLDMRFSGVQELAEHLLVKTSVNTKSVAAFTLIAAMQESGKYNLKGSALFSSNAVNVGGDKHKETNLLLQRKLQQNKDILRQKEKAQALREELQQQMGSQSNNKTVSGSKTPVSTQKKSVTSSTVSSSALSSSSVAIAPLKSPRIPSSNSNPLTAQSPQKLQSPKKPVSPWLQQKTPGGQGQSCETGSQSYVTDHVTSEDFVLKNEAQSVDLNVIVSKSIVAEKKKDYFNEFEGYQLMDSDYEFTDVKRSANDTNVFEAKTPENLMETDHSELSHVRKINFDDLVAQQSNNKEISEIVDRKRQERTVSNATADTTEKLSKSTGFLSLKKMLESKTENQSSLNKSMGYSGKKKTALFVNQSTVPGRSAFVPFSMCRKDNSNVNQSVMCRKDNSNVNQSVMCRKDNSNVNQSVAMAIPVLIPSAAQTQSNQTVSQSTNITMIALPTDLQRSPTKNPSDIIPNEAILNLLSTSSMFKQPGAPTTTEVAFPTPLCDSVMPPLQIQNQTKESMSIFTVSSLLSKMAGNECAVSSSAQSLQNLPKQLRTKFTPIRPKASPNKVQPQREVKAEVPTYDKDKRPVSAILKEKRAKEQADAIAKFQSNIQQPSISLTGNQLSTLQGIQAGSSNIPPNEVVIIVNSRPVKLQQLIGRNSVVSETTVAASNTLSNQDNINFQTLVAGNKINTDTNATVSETADGNTENFAYDSDVPSEPNVSDDNDLKEIGSISSDMKEFSPMSEERDVTPILCEDDDADTISESDTVSEIGAGDNNNVDKIYGYNKCTNDEDVARADDDAMINDIVQPMWIETPIKIQKLNITSPFQDEITVALGRETPVKISKPSDLCLNRPESAETFGRETPSGARKRKSSDLRPRHDFKRLSSTGEDTEDQHNMSFVLSPDNDLYAGLNPRRTQSCTYELERENKAKHHLQQQQQQQQQIYQQHKQSGESLLQGLQSPDIHSLEREALIESFPNSLYAMKPHHKSHKNQSSSVGVNAKTLRQSQQKLIKQQQYLNERVKNFLQTQTETSQSDETEDSEPVSRNSNHRKISQISPGSRTSLKTDNYIVTDRGKPYQRPSSAATVCSRSSNVDVEPSGLPSEVADWINETIEKRQKTNQSAMSEPEYRDYLSMKAEQSPKQQNFKFEVGHVVQSGNTSNAICTAGNNVSIEIPAAKNSPQSSNDDSNFTVPKAPPVSNFRSKEALRSNTELPSINQRCQSLPIFVSPVQSPVSPMALPIGRNHSNTRAASMSPRAQVPEQSTEMLSPTTGGIMSPVRRKEFRDGQVVSPAQTSLYPSLGHRDPKQGTYLASIQHSLQKPVDTSHDLMSPQDVLLGKHPLAIVNLGGKSHSLLHHGSREPSIDADDHYVSHAPFSDSGYHSCGPSPILNSTSLSVADNSDLVYGQRRGNSAYKHVVVESPVTMITEYTSPVLQLSPQQSPNNPQLTIHQQNVTMATSQMNNLGMNPSQLRSSIHSAFIPIQGSHHDVRYVTPIKPMVTLPSNSHEQNSISENVGISSSLFIEANHPILGTEVTMVSPRSADPPSYEVAIKQLKTSTSSKLGPGIGSQSLEVINSIDTISEQNSKLEQQHLLLANMGVEQADNLGPFAQKLMKLSHQTHNGGKVIQTLLSNELISSNTKTVSMVANPQSSFIPAGNDLCILQPDFGQSVSSILPPTFGNSQSVSSILPPNFGNNQSVSSILPATIGNSQSVSSISNSNINPNGATLHFNFTGDMNTFTDNHLMKDNTSLIDQTKTNFVVKPISAIKSVLSNNIPRHSMLISNSDETVLNIDPSFHSSSHFGSANQTAEETLMTSLHHHESASLSENENNRLLNKPTISFPQDFKETQRFQVSNTEINLFSNDRKDHANTINVLIGGKMASQDLVIVSDAGQNKPEISPQELMDDIGLTWESLREIEGDVGDFNMLN